MWTTLDRPSRTPPRCRRSAPWAVAAPQPTIAEIEQSLLETKLAVREGGRGGRVCVCARARVRECLRSCLCACVCLRPRTRARVHVCAGLTLRCVNQVAEAQRECQHKLETIVRQQFAAEDLEAELLHAIETLRREFSTLDATLVDVTKVAQQARGAALPALAAATDALSDLNRADIAELRSYALPTNGLSVSVCVSFSLRACLCMSLRAGICVSPCRYLCLFLSLSLSLSLARSVCFCVAYALPGTGTPARQWSSSWCSAPC